MFENKTKKQKRQMVSDKIMVCQNKIVSFKIKRQAKRKKKKKKKERKKKTSFREMSKGQKLCDHFIGKRVLTLLLL